MPFLSSSPSVSIRLLVVTGLPLLLGACAKPVASTPIPEDLVSKLIDHEQSLFASQEGTDDQMGYSKNDRFASHSGKRVYLQRTLAGFDEAEPHLALVEAMNRLIVHAESLGLGVREDSATILGHGPSDSIEPYQAHAYFHYRGDGVSSASGGGTDASTDRFIHAEIAFGHRENISFLYTWDLVYDVETRRANLVSLISYAEPVLSLRHGPGLGTLEIRHQP